MKVKIEIDTQTFVRFWLVVIGFAFALLAIYSARAALIIIGSALFLAIALNGPVSWLANLLPGKSRIGGTAIAYIIVVALLGMFVFMVVPPIAQQMSKFVDTVPGLIDSATTQWQGLDELIGRYHLEAQVNEGVAALLVAADGQPTDQGRRVCAKLFDLARAREDMLAIIFCATSGFDPLRAKPRSLVSTSRRTS